MSKKCHASLEGSGGREGIWGCYCLLPGGLMLEVSFTVSSLTDDWAVGILFCEVWFDFLFERLLGLCGGFSKRRKKFERFVEV